MRSINKQELLKVPEVLDEISHHLWIESEKAGRDIGFDKAADEWIKKYSMDWMESNRPDLLSDSPKRKRSSSRTSVKKAIKRTATTKTKKRRAKTYFSG